MDWGLKNRLARMIKPVDGRSVMLACDHGYFMGPTRKLEVPRRTFEPLVPYADALSVTRGVLRTSVDPTWEVPILLRVSGGTSVLQNDLSDEGLTVGMKDALQAERLRRLDLHLRRNRPREADPPQPRQARRRRRGARDAGRWRSPPSARSSRRGTRDTSPSPAG